MESKAFHKNLLELRENLMNQSNNGFTDAHGQSVKPGDTVYYANRSTNATLIDADQDGEATIQLADGKLVFVKWHRLIKVVNK